MAPNLRLRSAAEEAHAREREKDSTFGPRPQTPNFTAPAPVKTNTNEHPGDGVFHSGAGPRTPGPSRAYKYRQGEQRA